MMFGEDGGPYYTEEDWTEEDSYYHGDRYGKESISEDDYTAEDAEYNAWEYDTGNGIWDSDLFPPHCRE